MEYTIEQVGIFVLMVMAIMNFAILGINFWQKIREVKKPHDDHVSMVQEHDEKLNHDFKSITDHEKRIQNIENDLTEVKEQNNILISAVKQLLKHCIDGNDINMLKVEHGIMERYLDKNYYGKSSNA